MSSDWRVVINHQGLIQKSNADRLFFPSWHLVEVEQPMQGHLECHPQAWTLYIKIHTGTPEDRIPLSASPYLSNTSSFKESIPKGNKAILNCCSWPNYLLAQVIYIWKAKYPGKSCDPASWRLFAVSSFHPFRLLSLLPSYFLPVVLIIFLNPWLHLFLPAKLLSGLNSNLNIEAHWKRRCTQWCQLQRTGTLFLYCKK